MSTDRRSNRDEVRISKLEYLGDYAHCTNINDTNITEKEVVLRKTGTKKKYMTAQRMVYTRPVKKIYQAFVETGFACSISTFIKYKPFYITAPTEREKESFLFKKCLNAHLLLAGINNFRKAQKLPLHTSATDFLNDQDSHDHRTKYPECYDISEVSFYIFEKKEETYFKNGIEKSCERVAHIDKKIEVKEVAKTLIEQDGSYLRHRSHIANIKNTLPLIRESFNGKYIEMNFSENIAMKPKFEVQDAHFSGKQYSLHCSIVEAGIKKYFYHLSDDTTHDPEFVHEVLVDLFDKFSIKNETIMIKSDNAPT